MNLIPRFFKKTFPLETRKAVTIISGCFPNEHFSTYNRTNQKRCEILNNKSCGLPIRIHCKKNYSTLMTRDRIMKERRDFAAAFPDIVRELEEKVENSIGKETSDRFKCVLEYNNKNGKRNRGLLVLDACKSLLGEITPANVRLAHILGWCLELMQSYCLVLDDVLDNSITRRQQLCWYKMDDVGLVALNDALLMEQAIYYLLRKHFAHLECYKDLINLFHETEFITFSGQSLDVLSEKQSVATFTRDMYRNIVIHKTAFYTIHAPVAIGMHLAGCKDADAFRETKVISLELGVMFQIQDDFLDCFGSTELTGKIGTDIRENKCSWLAVECMQRANEEQKAIMMECYGTSDPEKIARVKQLYIDLELPSVYADYEAKTFNQIKQAIKRAPNVPKDVLLKIVNSYVGRSV